MAKNYVLKILRYFKPPPISGMTVKTLQGFKFFIDPLYDKGIEKRLYQNGTYEAGTLWCLEHLIKPGNVVIDAGANIGLISILAGKLVGSNGTVYSFEPLKQTFDLLEKNIKLNNAKNISALQIALSDYEGSGKLYPNIHINRGAASLNKNRVEQDVIDVQVSTLNIWTEQNKINHVDLLKIDVEGLELEVLKGGSNLFRKKIKPILCLEYSEEVQSSHNKHELFYFLKDHGYRIFKSRLGKEIPSKLIEISGVNDLPQHDNIYGFCNKSLIRIPELLFEYNQNRRRAYDV